MNTQINMENLNNVTIYAEDLSVLTTLQKIQQQLKYANINSSIIQNNDKTITFIIEK